MKKSISIALCTYNGEKFIGEQLASLINQTRQADEIIICDDHSTDNTIEIVKQIMEPTNLNWTLKINQVNLGFTKNFEQAIHLCTGDIILLSDQDDYWLNNKIEKFEHFFTKNNNSLIIFSDAELVDKNLNKLNTNLWKARRMQNFAFETDSFSMLKKVLNRNMINGCTMGFKRHVLQEAIPFSPKWSHDEWIVIVSVLCNNGSVYAIPESLILYRQHENNVYGYKHIGILKRVSRFIIFGKRVQDFRNHKQEMFKELDQHIRIRKEKIDKMKINQLNECLNFWERKFILSHSGIFQGLRIIFEDLLLGYYHRFYTGFRSAFRDLILLIIDNWFNEKRI